MAFTQADLDKVNRQITSAKMVQDKDRRVENRDLGELLRLRSIIEAEMGTARPAPSIFQSVRFRRDG